MSDHYAIGRYAAAALRAKAKATAEMTSQLLFGEPVTVLEASGNYRRVRCSDDEFEGYVRADQLLTVPERTYRLQRENPAFNLDLFSTVLGDQQGMPVTFGARLPEFDGMRLCVNDRYFNFTGQAALSEDLRTEADLLIRFARRWLFVPGLTGGRTPSGIDPAAFVQLVTRLINLKLPRTAPAMSQHGRMVDFVVQAQAGDLAYFDNRRGEIDHVGILLPDSQLLHVHDRVRIDAVDHYGVYNYELGKYTHRLRIVKRLLPDSIQQGVLQSKRERVAAAENQITIF